MTKARLKSDLELDYVTQYATFRGQETGTKHYAIEMYKPSCYGRNGPNDGLIRRLYVGRFMEDNGDGSTTLTYYVDVEFTGRLATLGARIVKRKINSDIGLFFDNIRDRAES